MIQGDNCEKEIIVTPGTDNFPIYDITKKVYRNEHAIILECANCRELIVLINYQKQDIEMIVIDEKLQTSICRFCGNENPKHLRKNKDGTCCFNCWLIHYQKLKL